MQKANKAIKIKYLFVVITKKGLIKQIPTKPFKIKENYMFVYFIVCVMLIFYVIQILKTQINY
jgi:hypothetical protein